MRTSSLVTLCLSFAFVPPVHAATGPALRPVVEVEEDLYRYEPADNGAGPCGARGPRAWRVPAVSFSPAAWRRSKASSR